MVLPFGFGFAVRQKLWRALRWAAVLASRSSVEAFGELPQLLESLGADARRARSGPVGDGDQPASERTRSVGREPLPADGRTAIDADADTLEQRLSDQHGKSVLRAASLAADRDRDVELRGRL